MSKFCFTHVMVNSATVRCHDNFDSIWGWHMRSLFFECNGNLSTASKSVFNSDNNNDNNNNNNDNNINYESNN